MQEWQANSCQYGIDGSSSEPLSLTAFIPQSVSTEAFKNPRQHCSAHALSMAPCRSPSDPPASPRLASQNDDNHDFQKCTHSSLHRKIPLSCCCSVTRGGCGLASCGLAWGKTKRSAVLIWMGISSKRSFKISLFLPLLILLYNLDIICAKKVLLTCNDCIAAGCGTLNPTQKNKNKNISISISMI